MLCSDAKEKLLHVQLGQGSGEGAGKSLAFPSS